VMDLPEGDWREGDALVAYARPHLMRVRRTKVSPVCLNATIQKVSAVGPIVRVDLTTKAGEPLVVKISQDQQRLLNLKEGEEVFVAPGETEFFPDIGASPPSTIEESIEPIMPLKN
jgi:ABC-type sulfate/molybdate transport systems ATPase subunit